MRNLIYQVNIERTERHEEFPIFLAKWLTEILVVIAVVEAVYLYRRRPQSLSFAECGSSLFILYGKPLLYVPLKMLLQTHAFTAVLVAKVLIVSWPYRLMTMPKSSWWIWLVLFFAVDFFYYWEHRLKHSIRWFWPNHSVHHSSEHFNLMMAFRLGWTGSIATNLFFYVPLVLVGFRPHQVMLMLTIQQTYQFFVHCDWVPKLGWIEKVFVTPSHHRVHHAIDDGYIDRNFGGVLILYDRIFGTFTEEKGPCRYGLVEPVGSHNPIRILTAGWVALYRGARQQTGFFNVLRYLFGPLREVRHSLGAVVPVHEVRHEKVS